MGSFSLALQSAKALGLTSELGIALCFDIQVQNGGINSETRQLAPSQASGQPKRALREALANLVADHAKPQFQSDVRSRKPTIARGEGVVHVYNFLLAAWGLV